MNLEIIRALVLLAAAAGFTVFGYWKGESHEHQVMQAQLDEIQAKWSEERAAESAAAASAAEANQTETARRFQQQEVIRHDAELQANSARADADAARAAAERLRQQLATYRASGGAGGAHPPATPGSAPASDPAGVLADVLSESVERYREMAEIAGARGTAGTACVRVYDALSATPTP